MTSYRHYSEQRFRAQIEDALTKVRTILDDSRNPKYAADEPIHAYSDKYGLAEFLTNVAMASQMNVLDVLGVDEEKFRKMHSAVMAGRQGDDDDCGGDCGGSVGGVSVGGASMSSRSVGGVSVGGGGAPNADGRHRDEADNDNFGSTDQNGDPYPSSVVMRFAAEETCSFFCEELVDADDRHHVPVPPMKDASEHGHGGGEAEQEKFKRSSLGSAALSVSMDELNRETLAHQRSERRKENKGFFRQNKVSNKVTEYHWKVSIDYSVYVIAERSTDCEDQQNDDQSDEDEGDRKGASRRRRRNRSKSYGSYSQLNGSYSQLNSSFTNLKGSFSKSRSLHNLGDGGIGNNSNSDSNRLYLQSRTATTEIITTANRTPPLPPKTSRPPIDVDITWLFRHISRSDFNCSFTIDRNSETCSTPRRNQDVEGAMVYFADMARWCDNVCTYFLKGTAWNVDLAFGTAGSHHAMSGGMHENEGEAGALGGSSEPQQLPRRVATLESIRAGAVFNPVLPLFEAPAGAKAMARRRRWRSRCYYTPDDEDGDGDGDENDSENRTDRKINDIISEHSSSSTSPSKERKTEDSPLLPITDVHLFLNEQCRTLDEKIGELTSIFPPASSQTKLVTSAEAIIVLLACHSASITEHYLDGLQSIEENMRSSLTKAIGSEVTEEDFSEFVKFHDARLFRKEYVPRPMNWSVRRPRHFPEGTVSIEKVGGGGASSAGGRRQRWEAGQSNNNNGSHGNDAGPSLEMLEDDGAKVGEPILTLCREVHFDDVDNLEDEGMKIPITASTSAHLAGTCFLHGWISHQFEGRRDTRHQLVARARQFSCFMLFIGSISAPRTFEPSDAIIVQNKDEVLVPLILGQVPTADEFYESISSLSPDQQRFASAVRDIQLESSVFGVCVVQIRPQLEVLLDLPEGSLTKEVRLTEDLLSLFVDHQIPSDLVSYDGPDDGSDDGNDNSNNGGTKRSVTRKEKINTVKEHVADVQEMIKDIMDEDETVSAEFTTDASVLLENVPSSERNPPRSDMSTTKRGMLMFPDISFDPGSIVDKSATILETKPIKRERSSNTSVHLSTASKLATTSDLLDDDDDKFAIEPEPTAVIKRVPSLGYLDSLHEAGRVITGSGMDLTSIPRRLHAEYNSSPDAEQSVLRPTIVHTADVWTKRRQGKNLLSRKFVEHSLGKGERKMEKRRAMDLLDALSRSGSLSIAHSELHAIVGATHCFDHSLIDTVIRDNVDPIEKMSRSTLKVASAIYGMPVSDIVHENAQV